MFNDTDWRAKRSDAMQSARHCRDALTDPNGFWKYPAGSDRVKSAVRSWVLRARQFHDIALGREPLIRNMLVIGAAGSVQGDVYVRN